ncbi:MAG: ATP-binding protein, partial [Planctomycetota bacterium]
APHGVPFVNGKEGVFRWQEGEWRLLHETFRQEPVVNLWSLGTDSCLVAFGDRIETWDFNSGVSEVWRPSLPAGSRSISFVAKSTSGDVWVGNRGSGVVVRSGEAETRYTSRDALLSGRVVRFLEAKDKSVWVGSEHRGVSWFRGDRWIHYGHEDGVPSDELLGLAEYPAGTFWAVFDHVGLYRYEPDRQSPDTEILESPVEIASGGVGVFSFSGYDSDHHTSTGDLEYSWRVLRTESGSAGDWSRFSRERSVATGPLRPGGYRFEVRSQDRDGNTDPSPAFIEVTVLAPLWQRTEFVSIVGALTALCLVFAWRQWKNHRLVTAHRDRLDLLVRNRTQELVASHAALGAEKERLSVTLQNIADAVVTTDRKGRIVLMNAVAERLCSMDDGLARGELLTDVFPLRSESTLEPVLEIVSTFLDSEPARLDGPLLLRDSAGNDRTIEAHGAAVRNLDGETIGAVLVLRDVTALRQLEQDRSRADRLDSLGDLAGGIAHDFRNLLATVMSNVSMLEEGGVDEGVIARLKAIDAACQKASSLTDELLTFSKGGAPVRRTCRIEDVVREALSLTHEARGAEVECHFGRRLWDVKVDPDQISRVVQNLLINATQASDSDSRIVIRAENCERTDLLGERFQALSEEHYVRVSVRDYGSGIAPQVLSRLFDPYFTTKSDGNGLGLAVCHSIVRKHHGIFSVDSTIGKGSEFAFFLPASLVTGAPEASPTQINERANPKSSQTGEPKSDPSSPLNVLVMDDEALVRSVVCDMVEACGHRVFPASDGDEALNVFHRAREDGDRIDLAILDLTVPGKVGGVEALRRLRIEDEAIIGVVSSGYARDPVLANFRDYGFQAVISKPYHLDRIRATIRSVFETHGVEEN